MKKIKKKIIKKISKILNVKEKELIEKKDFSTFEEWDSLKHLEIITFLDDVLGKKIKNKNLSKITNLKKILSLLDK